MKIIIDRVLRYLAWRQIEFAFYEGKRVAHASAMIMVDEEGIPGASWQSGSAKNCMHELHTHFRRCAATDSRKRDYAKIRKRGELNV